MILLRYIKANWKGYEIDSSEFFAEILSENTCKTIQAFLDSSSIDEKFRTANIISSLNSAYEIAISEDKDLVSSLKINNVSFSKIIDKYNSINESDIKKDNLIELCQIVQILVQNFPHLIFEFNDSLIRFERKGAEESNNYEMTIIGVPVTFMVSWYETEAWEGELRRLRYQGRFRYNSWL